MKNIKKNILYTLIFAGIFFGASCLKKQNLEEESLGFSVPPQEIAAALESGFGELDYNQIKVNEKSSIILTQAIQDGSPQTLEQQDITIQSVTNAPSYLQLDFLAKTIQYSGGSTNEDIRVWNKVFTKYSGYAFAAQNSQINAQSDLDEPLFMFQIIQNLALGSCYEDSSSYPESCHNLQVSDVNYKVPPIAANQHGCADIHNCFIPAKRIEFDLVQKYNLESDGKPKRIHYTLVLSPHVPFNSRVLKYCSRTLYDIPGIPQKVLADLCYTVNNYTFGQ